MSQPSKKILFVINEGSGRKKNLNWKELIATYFEKLPHRLSFFTMPPKKAEEALEKMIVEIAPDIVVAVGGDGTVTFVAKKLMNKNIAMGILPAGSANGMAKELQIPDDPEKALEIVLNGVAKKTDLIAINEDKVCLHLSDLGLNARLIRYFEERSIRGQLGYSMALVKALYRRQPLSITVELKGKELKRQALMVIIANASKYGIGANINPRGNIHDGMFEVVIVNKLSFTEILKMFMKVRRFDPRFIEIFGATSASIETRRPEHFQVDGEYLGKTTQVKAKVLAGALLLIMPVS